jgi:hypothetical protein
VAANEVFKPDMKWSTALVRNLAQFAARRGSWPVEAAKIRQAKPFVADSLATGCQLISVLNRKPPV